MNCTTLTTGPCIFDDERPEPGPVRSIIYKDKILILWQTIANISRST